MKPLIRRVTGVWILGLALVGFSIGQTFAKEESKKSESTKEEAKKENEAAIKAKALEKYEAEIKKKKAREEKIGKLIKDLSSDDMDLRDAAEQDLKKIGKPALPQLKKAKPDKEEALKRVRRLIVNMSLDASSISEESADGLMVLAKEEALAKRYGNAKRCYRRAEKIYDKLKDDADDRKDREAENRLEDKQDKADERADRAGHLEKGRKFSGLNLGVIKIGKEHDTSDEDW